MINLTIKIHHIINLKLLNNIYIYIQNVVHMDSATLSCSITNPNEPNTPPKSFAFDGVYGPDSTTEAIYNDNGFALVEVNKYMWKLQFYRT